MISGNDLQENGLSADGGKTTKWLEIKKVVMKSRYIIGGLILASIPRELEQSRFILSVEDQTFWHGLATGIFLAMRIIGVCIFAYGIAYFAEKTAIVKDGEKTEKDD